MAVKPGGRPSPQLIEQLITRMQQRGQAQGIPGLGNVGSQSRDHYRKILQQYFAAAARAGNKVKTDQYNQYLRHEGPWSRARNPKPTDLPRQGGGAGQSARNPRQRGALPHFAQFAYQNTPF